ncbi:MAG: TRAP transporter substrate-binding protein [Rhodobacteraceae bacterium]|nr:TRAP transporter substrate-binding protein [Paracoccaceae bacterium]
MTLSARKQTLLRAVTATAVASALVVIGTVDADAQRRMTATSLYAQDKPQTQVWVKFRELLEERLPGEFDLRIVTDGAMGGEKEEAEGILLGSINCSLSTIANLTTWVPEGALFDMPFMFRDQAHIDAVMSGPIGQDMKDLYRAQGFTVFDFITYGARQVLTKSPMTSPEQVVGRTKRVLPAQLHIDLWDSLGANPTAVPITEAYSALETGVVDMMDMTKSGYHALRLFEVAPFLTETNHIYALGVVYCGNNFFDTLTPEQQEVFNEIAPIAAAHFNELAEAEQEASLAIAIAGGATVVEADIEAWQAAMAPFWEAYADQVGGIDRIMAIVETQ